MNIIASVPYEKHTISISYNYLLCNHFYDTLATFRHIHLDEHMQITYS